MSIQFNGVAVDSVYFNGSLLTEFVVNGINVLSEPTGFVLQFDGTATTNVITGKRELVNAGTSGVPATLYGGQGIDRAGSDARADTGVSIDFSKAGSLFMQVELTGTKDTWFLGVYDGGVVPDTRCYVSNGGTSNKISINIGGLVAGTDSTVLKPFTYTNNSLYTIGATWDGNGNYIGYINGNEFNRYTGANSKMVASFPLIGYFSPNYVASVSADAISKDYYYIPTQLTQSEIQSHYNNPERTLYWDNGVLKSGLPSITPSVIADMQAGNGFWYPLCENVDCSGFVANASRSATDYVQGKEWNSTSGENVVNVIRDTVYGDILDVTHLRSYSRWETDLIIPADTIYVSVECLESTVGKWRLLIMDIETSTYSYGIIQNGKVSFIEKFTEFTGSLGVRVTLQAREDATLVGKFRLRAFTQSEGKYKDVLNWTPSIHTNAQEIEYGLEMPLLETDAFGVPTGLASIDWQANTGTELVAEALAENNLNVVITGDDANPTAIDIYEA